MKTFKWVDCPKPKSLKTEKVFGKRHYKGPNGESFASVTTVVGMLSKDSIKAWRERIGEEKADEISRKAASLGTSIHNMAERYLRNEKAILNESVAVQELFHILRHEIDGRLDNIRVMEETLYSNVMKMAGRVDCIAEYDGKLSIIDFKTSKEIKKREWVEGYFCQAWTYAYMWEEMYGQRIDNVAIVMVASDGEVYSFLEEGLKAKKSRLKTVMECKKQYDRELKLKEDGLKQFLD